MPTITAGMLHDRGSDAGDHACLTLKAWNGRVFLAYLDCCLNQQLQSNQASGRHDPELILATVATRSLLLWFCEQEGSHRRYLTEGQAETIHRHGIQYLQHAAALAKHASSNNLLRWKVLPKHHVSRREKFHVCHTFWDFSVAMDPRAQYCIID